MKMPQGQGADLGFRPIAVEQARTFQKNTAA